VADTSSILCYSSGTVNLVANDSDPENNVPLALVSITNTSGSAVATLLNASSVTVDTYDKGPSTFTYTVADSLGASSTGQLTVTSTGSFALCASRSGGP
jgi:hypothetical protein